MRALYFVRWRPSLGAKLGIPHEFPPNCFPITQPRNGNIGNGYRDLLESGFKIGKNLPMPKKIAGEIFTKNKNNFFGTCLFSTFKAKNVIFCSRMCFLSSVKIIFQKFSIFLQILSPIWLCAILCAPTVHSNLHVPSKTLGAFSNYD